MPAPSLSALAPQWAASPEAAEVFPLHLGFPEDKKSVWNELRGIDHTYLLFLVKAEQKYYLKWHYHE